MRRDLGARYEYVSQAVAYQDHFIENLGWPAWWSVVGPGPQLSPIRGSDISVADRSARNGSRNSTSAFEADGGECGADSSGWGIVDCGTIASH